MNINVTDQLTYVNNRVGNIHRPVLVLQWRGMNTKINRRLQLLRVIEVMFYGESGKCADALEIKRPQLSRWITKNEKARQGISEDSARYIERKLGLPRGSLDADMGEPVTKGKVVRLKPPVQAVEAFESVYNSVNRRGKKFLTDAIDAARAGFLEDKKDKSKEV